MENDKEFSFEQFSDPSIKYPVLKTGDFGIVKNGFLTVRRNLEGIPFRPAMSQENNENLLSILNDFRNSLPVL